MARFGILGSPACRDLTIVSYRLISREVKHTLGRHQDLLSQPAQLTATAHYMSKRTVVAPRGWLSIKGYRSQRMKNSPQGCRGHKESRQEDEFLCGLMSLFASSRNLGGRFNQVITGRPSSGIKLAMS